MGVCLPALLPKKHIFYKLHYHPIHTGHIYYCHTNIFSHIVPKKGKQLGTASATWKKIKSLNSKTTVNKPKSTSNSDEEIEIDLDSDDLIVDYTSDGEVILAYLKSKKLQIWSTNSEGDCLVLVYRGNFQSEIESTVKSFKCIGRRRFLTIEQVEQTQDYFLYDYTPLGSRSVKIPAILSKLTSFTIKASNNYIILGNNEGLLYIYSYAENKLEPANKLNKLIGIKKESCNPMLLANSQASIEDDEIILQSSINSKTKQPIFDIIDNWLVYCPTKFEYLHLKATNSSPKGNEIIDPFKSPDLETPPPPKPTMFTPMKLPHRGPLLNRVLSSFSNSATDGLFKLSELTVKNYKKQQITTDMSLNSISKGIGKLLYNTASSTANTIQKQASNMKPNDNHVVKIIDLATDKVLGVFKPPGGINNLSLSPYDLQLVQTTLKGDVFYMWDLYKLPQEISLIGKFNRGKTSATVEEIFWFINCHELDIINQYGKESTIKANNSGFGCITKATGTVHWFNTNYLSGNSDNFPNSYNNSKKFTDFLDSWILPSIGAKKFIPLPQNSHLKKGGNKTMNKSINQLAIVDGKNQLKLLSTLDGAHMYKYDLPRFPLEDVSVVEKDADEPSIPSDIVVQPLSQAEIETCSPFLHMINNNNIEFATYKTDSSLTSNVFGTDIPVNVIKQFAKNQSEKEVAGNQSDILGGLFINAESIEIADEQTNGIAPDENGTIEKTENGSSKESNGSPQNGNSKSNGSPQNGNAEASNGSVHKTVEKKSIPEAAPTKQILKQSLSEVDSTKLEGTLTDEPIVSLK